MPTPGDRYTRKGEPDVVITAVSGTSVSFTRGTEKFTVSLEHFLELEKRTMQNTLLSGSHNTHARLSPSSSKQWLNCTASLAMIEANSHRIPEDNSSEYSREGTEAHDWAAKVLLNHITIDEVPESFREPVGGYVERCLALVPEGVSYQVEVQAPLFYQPSSYGTCDFAIITEERVWVRDYKHGAGVLVSADGNSQLAIYALSLIRMMEDIYDFSDDTIIDIGIDQPRHREAENAQPWIITLKELTSYGEAIHVQAMLAFSGVSAVQAHLACGTRDFTPEEILKVAPGVEFVPQSGDDGSCRWCDCKAWCPAKIASSSEGMDLPDVSGSEMLALLPEIPEDGSIETVVCEVVKDAPIGSDEYLFAIWKNRKNIARVLADAEEYFFTRAIAGNPVPGTKLVVGGQGDRKWVDENAADVFLKGQGLKQEDRYTFKLKGPAPMEKVLKEKLKNTRTKNRFDALITRAPGKPVLALADDPRETLTSAVGLLPEIDD